MTKVRWLIIITILVSSEQAVSQAGRQVFQFMNIPSHARISGLGGVLVSQPGTDVNLVISNPAQSTDSLDGMFGFSYLDYFADSRKFQAAYQHDLGPAGSWFVAVDHLSYGDFDGYDDTGQDLGELSAGETLVLVGTTHAVGIFRLGASLKFVSSQLAGYNASGMAVDLGGTFRHPARELSVGLVFRNLGVVFNDYSESNDALMPFDVQAGVTFKPRFMPFRFSFTAHDLTDWDTAQFDEDDRPGTVDQLFRHLNVGAELLVHRNLELRVGYNHQIRTDLRVEGAGGGSGITYGLAFRIKSLEVAYSRGGYSAAAAVNNFTVLVDTKTLFSKKIKI